jgi:hypothetical protein
MTTFFFFSAIKFGRDTQYLVHFYFSYSLTRDSFFKIVQDYLIFAIISEFSWK